LQSRADWMLATRNANLLAEPEIAAAVRATPAGVRKVRLWTDNRSNVIEILK
jgi:hypothetical protein